MDDLEKKFFLIIKPNYFALNVISENSKILFKEEFFNNNLGDCSISLIKFLDDKIFKVEKELKFYIKDINLIIEDKNFLNFDLSLIKDFKDTFNNTNDNLSEISNIKESILKSNSDFQLVHMIINKFIIDEKDYLEIPYQKDKKNLFLEIKFICLKIERLIDLKKTLSKYQINIKKIFNYEYVKSFKIDDLITFKFLKRNVGEGLALPNGSSFLISLKNSLLNAIDDISSSYINLHEFVSNFLFKSFIRNFSNIIKFFLFRVKPAAILWPPPLRIIFLFTA